MSRMAQQKGSDVLIRTLRKKYGMKVEYVSDRELHRELAREGLPALSQLLKMIPHV